MEMEVGESYIKKTLRNLCLSYGWSYGVFWRFDPRNHMSTLEDAYYEGHVANLMGSMLVQAFMLGEGIIGQAALHGQHRWLFNSWEDPQLNLQFSYGIKTIAVIPVEQQSVVQFGSTSKNFESLEFLVQAKRFLNVHDDGLLTSMISTHTFCEDFSVSMASNTENYSLFDSLQFPGELLIDPSLGSGPFEPAQISASSFDTYQMDDLSQLLADASKLRFSESDIEAMLSNDILSSIPGTQPACSSHSTLTNNVSNSCREEKPLVFGANNIEVLDEFGINFGCEAKINPIHNSISTSLSDCISDVGVHIYTTAPPKKALFSEIGLDHLLKDASSSLTNKSSIEDHWPSIKKRKIEQCRIANDQVHHSYDSLGVKDMQPTSFGGSKKDLGSLKQCMENTQAKLWIDESFSVDAKSCLSDVNGKSQKDEEPPKGAKKRAKPGESTRPRPKDRQLIADRIKDLRDLIPNGAKLSIDALLGRTIKHMLFLQNLNKHADKLKQVDEPKLIGQDNSLTQRSSSSSMSSSGNARRNATWAYEVGGSNLLCPIVVEDLDEPGQMLIEMLCEERGYFLEIADIVRSFGLTILKGVMEARNDKIWAHFIVEGNKHVTRMDVFISLMQILQSSNSSEVLNTKCETLNTVTGTSPLWGDNFQQHVMPLPI